jgi:diacylglycerol kinase (ATP)
MRVGLVFNPHAGGGRAAAAAESVQACLEHHGLEFVVRTTEEPQQATFMTAELAPSVDAIVAIGGDGTVNEVINGLPGSDVPLGIVPAGTVNVLALELGLPFNVQKACEVIARGHSRTLDLGRVDGRRFVLMVGVGLDALTIRELDQRAKKRYKELAFVWTGVRSYIRHPPVEFTMHVDGEPYTATYAVVGNCRYYGGRFGVTTRADPTDGLFDVLLYRDRGFGPAAAFWAGVPLGVHVHYPGVTYLRARHVEFEAPDEGTVWFQTDGELAGRLPALVEIEDKALRVFVP